VSFDEFLGKLASKKQMHDLIDSLGDDDDALLLTRKNDPEDPSEEFQSWASFGGMTIEQAYFRATCFLDAIMHYKKQRRDTIE
jgi:hypothetical protein